MSIVTTWGNRVDVALKIDDSILQARVRNIAQRLPYWVENGINTTAKRIQQAEFAHVRSTFIIRKPEFFFGTATSPGGVAARISPFASARQGRLYAEISVTAGSLASQRRTLLAGFEEGGLRQPFTPGALRSAAPITGRPARPSISGPVPPQYTFAGLHFVGYQAGKRLRRRRRHGGTDVGIFGEFGKVSLNDLFGNPGDRPIQWKGRERTFILPFSRQAPGGGVFQRFGPARGDVREIMAFLPPFHLDRRLAFVRTAVAVAQSTFSQEIEAQLAESIVHDALLHGL